MGPNLISFGVFIRREIWMLAETEGRGRPCPGAFLVPGAAVCVCHMDSCVDFIPALCMDPGLPGLCPDVILALSGLLLCWKSHLPRPQGQQYGASSG